MAIEAFTPQTEKDRRTTNYQRQHSRSQDHGDRETFKGHRKQRFEKEYTHPHETILEGIHPLERRMARQATALALAERQPTSAELEREADRLLMQAGFDDVSTDITEANDFDEQELAEATEQEMADSGRLSELDSASLTLTNSQELGAQISAHLRNTRLRGPRGGVETVYQGRGSGIGASYEPYYTDDELLDEPNPLDGFSIKDRP